MWLNWGLYLLIYWEFDCTGKCGMDHNYASFREFASNFRPARVFHSAFAVTSYYAYLKQRMKTLFQISSLWATPHILYTPSYRPPYKETTEQRTLTLKTFSRRHCSQPTLDLLSHFVYMVYNNAKTKTIQTDWLETWKKDYAYTKFVKNFPGLNLSCSPVF